MAPTTLLLSAGEASGDMYAAQLARELQKLTDVEIFGMGGAEMRAAGVDVITDYHEVSVVGITEILSHLPSLIRAMRKLVSAARLRKPALAIVTDFPGFHLRLARKLKPLGVKNVYFICPQFWAWRPWRARLIRRRFALALCIFPFEEKFFADAGVQVKYIGHPLAGQVCVERSREQFCREHGLDPHKPIVTILPGSRRGELAQHLPVLFAACRRISAAEPVQLVMAAAPGRASRLRESLPQELRVGVVEGQTYDALAAADASIVSSGTATVEAALLDAPMVVVYRVTPLTALLAKPLVRAPFFSMVNLIAGRAVVPELIQARFTAENVSAEILKLLREPAAREAMRRDLGEVRRRLGPAGAAERAARAISSLLPGPSGNAS